MVSGFPPILEPGSRNLLPFINKSIIEVQHWCGAWLAVGVHLKRCWLCVSLVKFFHTKLGKPFLYGIVMLKQGRAKRKLLPQRQKHNIWSIWSKILYAVDFPTAAHQYFTTGCCRHPINPAPFTNRGIMMEITEGLQMILTQDPHCSSWSGESTHRDKDGIREAANPYSCIMPGSIRRPFLKSTFMNSN